ncbi:YhdP family protein [Rhizobium sp.]
MVHHVRGEKVVFGKGDFHTLDAMPSCDHDDAMVLAPPRKKSWSMRLVKLFFLLFFLAVLGIGGLWVALENGSLDETLTAQAEGAMARALGQDFKPEVRAVRLRFSSDWMLALEAADVEITHMPSGITALKTNSIKAVLDPVALLSGKIVLARAEIDSADGDLTFLPQSAPVAAAAPRIDAVPALLGMLYGHLDRAAAQLDQAGTREISAHNLSLRLPSPKGRVVKLSGFDFVKQQSNRFRLSTKLTVGRLSPDIVVSFSTKDGKAQSIQAHVYGIQTEPFAMKYSKATGERRQGVDVPLTLALWSVRDTSLELIASAAAGNFEADGLTQPVKSARMVFDYDFTRSKFEIREGGFDFGGTRFPIDGAVADLDKVTPGSPPGYAFEAVIENGIANAELAGEQPQAFNAKVAGSFIPSRRELFLPDMSVATEDGGMSGSLKMIFAPQMSPEISFSARSSTLSTRSVKQLWPFWFGAKPRDWVLAHIRNGVVTNAEIDVSLAAGRLPEHPEPFHFEEGEFDLNFDADGLDISYLGEMPAARATSGQFRMKDRRVAVAITRGEVPLPSGKMLTASKGKLVIADTAVKPLMASLDIVAAGDASAAAEYVSFKPIDASARLPFAASDLKGGLTADVSAVFGLIVSQDPPKPQWDASLTLAKVDLAKPIEGRKIQNLDGMLKINNSVAALDGKADIDGMGFDVKLSQPLTGDPAARQWEASGDLSEADVRKFAPALEPYLQGGVNVSLEGTREGQRATVQLRDTALSIPFINWRKGTGVKATAEFLVAMRDGQTRITDFTLDGDGFGAKGEMLIDKRGLVSGKFSRVKLSPADNFALTLERKSNGLKIDVSGNSIDAKPFIEQAKANSGGADGDKSSNVITAQVDRAMGYNKESLRGLDLRVVTSSGRISTISMSGVTASEQAVVIRKESDGGAMEITSGDAGAVARFADLYRNMNGGLLNITLRARDADSWRGSIDIRNFALINEARLKAIVSARGGKDGRSLTDALKTDIDTNSQKFRRAFARLMIDGGAIKVENGIVRGDQLGATFQGTVKSRSGNMDLTGTFMPAYGINSLFGQLPVIGTLLGNGRDRGLLGITFKMDGPYETPKMQVNPLSLIAPGVFRNIFEFE